MNVVLARTCLIYPHILYREIHLHDQCNEKQLYFPTWGKE